MASVFWNLIYLRIGLNCIKYALIINHYNFSAWFLNFAPMRFYSLTKITQIVEEEWSAPIHSYHLFSFPSVDGVISRCMRKMGVFTRLPTFGMYMCMRVCCVVTFLLIIWCISLICSIDCHHIRDPIVLMQIAIFAIEISISHATNQLINHRKRSVIVYLVVSVALFTIFQHKFRVQKRTSHLIYGRMCACI